MTYSLFPFVRGEKEGVGGPEMQVGSVRGQLAYGQFSYVYQTHDMIMVSGGGPGGLVGIGPGRVGLDGAEFLAGLYQGLED